MGKKLFVGLAYFWSIAIYIIAGLMHFWTVYIAYESSGLFWGIISFFFPVIAELVWGFNAWSETGFDSPYVQWLVILVIMWVVQMVVLWGVGIVGTLLEKEENNRKLIASTKVDYTTESRPIYFGFGGWLYVLAIGQILVFGRSLFYLVDSLLPIYTSGQIQDISQDNPLLAFGIFLESIINIYNVIIILISAYLCFKLKKSFKKIMIYFFSINLALAIVHFILIITIPNIDSSIVNDGRNVLINSAIVFILWVPYFIKSKRVQNTFNY